MYDSRGRGLPNDRGTSPAHSNAVEPLRAVSVAALFTQSLENLRPWGQFGSCVIAGDSARRPGWKAGGWIQPRRTLEMIGLPSRFLCLSWWGPQRLVAPRPSV